MTTTMKSGSATAPRPVPETATPVVDLDPIQVLDAAGDCVFAQTRADADLLEIAARWADLNPATEHSPAADWWDGEDVPVPGPIPEVAAPAVAEFAARIGRSTGAGKWLIFEALQLRHRLPRTWRLVQECRMPAFRARQLVMACYRLNGAAVDWLDRQMATVAGRVGPAQLERMVARAAAEHDPDFITEQRRKRYVRVEQGDPNAGIDSSGVHACVDPWDAVDLDAALNAGAEARKAWGSTADRDGRRAEALGDLARIRLGQATLPLDPGDAGSTDNRDGISGPAGHPDQDPEAGPSDTGDQSSTGEEPCGAGAAGHSANHLVPPLVTRPRELTMYVHLSDRAIHTGSIGDADRVWLGECGTTGQTVTADLVRQWCGNPDLTVIVKQVIDLREPVVTDTYRPSRQQREHVALTDRTCSFAHCSSPIHPVPTRRNPDGTLDHSWDADHTRAWHRGETTTTDGLVGLCRHHHRDKTLHGWRYRRIAAGIIVWRSPYGYDHLRTPVGTTDLGRHRPSTPPVPGWLHPGPLRPLEPDNDDETPPDPADDDLRPAADDDVCAVNEGRRQDPVRQPVNDDDSVPDDTS